MSNLALPQADVSQSGTEPAFAPIVHLPTTSVADTEPSPCTTPPMAFVRVDLENYDVVSSGIDVFQQAMESEPSKRCPGSHVSTDTPSGQQYLSQKDGHDDDLFSKTPPCTMGNPLFDEWSRAPHTSGRNVVIIQSFAFETIFLHPGG